MPHIGSMLVVGHWVMQWRLPGTSQGHLTETVRARREQGPEVVPWPHPSPRNPIGLEAHAWFATDALPRWRTRARARIEARTG